jgi:aryl-alcohol dehydrogenase-like predicted oxidoreductase
MAMLYRNLGSTGLKLSVVSLGGSGYGRIYGDFDEREARAAFRSAIDKGINYIDTSPFYGEGSSESFIGDALIGIPRDRYFIGTKVGRYKWDVSKRFDFSREKIISGFEESLRRLGLDYVDILQLHDAEFAPSIEMILHKSLPAVQKLKEKGRCRAIGVTGYPIQPLKDIVERSDIKIDSILTYSRLTLNDSSFIDHFDFFKEKDVGIINASPVSLGMLTRAGPQPWNSALPEIKEACKKAVEYCTQRGIDIAKLAVNYSTSFDEVTTTLMAINDSEMLDKNIQAALGLLTDEEEEMKKELIEKYFNTLKQKHWENVEVKSYWDQLKTKNT